jgi:hypothetical protein
MQTAILSGNINHLCYVDYPRIPMLHVGGVWDQEDIMGPQIIYAKMEKSDTNSRNYVIILINQPPPAMLLMINTSSILKNLCRTDPGR